MTNTKNLETILSENVGNFLIMNELSRDKDQTGGVIQITEDQFNSLLQSVQAVNQFTLAKRKIYLVQENYNWFVEVENELPYLLSKTKFLNEVTVQEMAYIEINRLLTNFITSLKSLIYDFLLVYFLPRLFGKDSEEVKLFDRKTKYWYNQFFAYRFLIVLRDFAVHQSFPIQRVNVDYNYQENDESIEKKASIEISFDRDRFLSNEKIKRKLKSDLTRYNNFFPVKPIVENIHFIFEDLFSVLVEIFQNQLRPHLKKIEIATQPFKEVGKISFGKVTLENHIPKFNSHTIVRSTINEVYKRVNREKEE